MTADIRLVTHTAEAHARVVAAHGLCNGLGNRGLADTRRAYKTENLSRHFRHHGMQSDALQYPFLDLFHTVMVFVQNGSCLF